MTETVLIERRDAANVITINRPHGRLMASGGLPAAKAAAAISAIFKPVYSAASIRPCAAIQLTY